MCTYEASKGVLPKSLISRRHASQKGVHLYTPSTTTVVNQCSARRCYDVPGRSEPITMSSPCLYELLPVAALTLNCKNPAGLHKSFTILHF